MRTVAFDFFCAYAPLVPSHCDNLWRIYKGWAVQLGPHSISMTVSWGPRTNFSEAWISLRRNRHWRCHHHHPTLTQLQCKLMDVNGSTMGIAEVIASNLHAMLRKAIDNIGFE